MSQPGFVMQNTKDGPVWKPVMILGEVKGVVSFLAEWLGSVMGPVKAGQQQKVHTIDRKWVRWGSTPP